MRPRSLPFCLAGWLCLFTTSALAQVEESPLRDVLHARGFGMAGAYRASGLGAEIINGNPAAVAARTHFIAELSGALDTKTGYRSGNLALVDNTVGGLAGGYTYALVRLGDEASRRTVHLNTLALAAPLSPNLSVGVSGRHILGRGAEQANAVTMDTGILAKFGPLNLGLSGHNLIDIKDPDLTRYYAAGAALSTRMFTLSGDVRGDWERDPQRKLALAYSVGAELAFSEAFPLRVGYAQDLLTDRRYVGGGLGLYSEGSGIDFAYRHELGPGIGRLFALTLRLQLG